MSKKIKLIVGLGNPGEKYTKTRHNAGFWFLDNLSSQFRFDKKFSGEIAECVIASNKILLLKPQTFMNLSGDSVQKCLQFYKIDIEEVLVAHDELDFPSGQCKLKQGGGHGGHNGLRDIIKKTSSKDFARLRIGIGRPEYSNQVANYVLKQPAKSEQQLIEQSIDEANRAIHILFKQDMSSAMLALHS